MLFGPNGVGRALDEGLDLLKVARLQLAREVGHAALHVWATEHELIETGNCRRRRVAEIRHIAAAVHPRHAVTEHTVAT